MQAAVALGSQLYILIYRKQEERETMGLLWVLRNFKAHP